MCLEDRDCAPESRERREFLFTAIAGSLVVTTAGVALGAEAPPPTRVLDDPPVEVFLYEGAEHGFLAYTRPYYRPDDARLSWKRTLAFLRRHL